MNPFTRHILNQIQPEVKAEFSERQIAALDEALGSSAAAGRHPVNIRGVLPLYFVRLFFVVLVGRDRRTSQQQLELYRRQKVDNATNILLLVFVVLPTLGIISLAFLYLIKVILGIDLFDGFHLRGFLGLH